MHGQASADAYEALTLTETSDELLDALREQLADVLGLGERDDGEHRLRVEPYHTGGGCMVAAIDLSQDGRLMGRQLWLTREEHWVLGFYEHDDHYGDIGQTEGHEGVCVQLLGSRHDENRPEWVAGQVAGIVRRLGVELEG